MLQSQPRSSPYYHIDTQSQQSQQQPRYDPNTAFDFNADQPLFDFQVEQYSQIHSQSLMAYGQLTPTSTTRAHHHRESSLSSLGSAGPSSPYTANTSNPQVAGDIHHEWYDLQTSNSKPLTPIHTPSQEHFLQTPHYNHFYQTTNIPFGMAQQEGPKIKSELMAAPEFNHPGRRMAVASRDSPATPPSYEDERQKNSAYRNSMPKLERTMTDVYSDELYDPNFQFTTISQPSIPAPSVNAPHNDIFAQRLQAANSQHLSASNTQIPLTIPSRDRSPFRQGSPLAPVGNSFSSGPQGLRFNSATQMREQQKADADARALQQQIERTSPSRIAPNTISPKDVDLVYHETEDDRNAPLFPPQQNHQSLQSPTYQQQTMIPHDPQELDDNTSHHSYGSMATSRRESSSAYSTASQGLQQQQSNFNFTPPSVPGGIRVPQQYPFVPAARRQTSNLSAATDDFPATLVSMESSSSEYTVEDNKKPAGALADTGTYTCTYHGCTLRFDSPAKLQRHKREGHRSSATVVGSGEENGMTSQAQRNSQAGPHKCERINPSTGKPCNTIFSRPYDLTRHEDTIHNARKQKVHCPICTEEKTFSRNDALTRHMRVVHPQYADQQGRRRRGAS